MRFSGMQKRSQKRGTRLSTREKVQLVILALAAVFVAIGLVLAGCRAHSTQADVPTVAPQYDRQFLHWLVNYHHDGDRMIDPCSINQTIRKELREFCATVDQQHKGTHHANEQLVEGVVQRGTALNRPLPTLVRYAERAGVRKRISEGILRPSRRSHQANDRVLTKGDSPGIACPVRTGCSTTATGRSAVQEMALRLVQGVQMNELMRTRC
jgi:hypothetical protein